MDRRIIDSHIHLDMYEENDREKILKELEENDVTALVSVSNNLASSHKQLELASLDERIKLAIGYHPEQPVADEDELEEILRLIDESRHRLIAIGEVGLPYYLRQQRKDLDIAPYINMLECFIQKAAQHDLPIVLHAVYEDADIACDLLEKHSVSRAHFHWFKGNDKILRRILENKYMISVTPEVAYRPKIHHLVKQIPLSQLMIETDGPWPFTNQFEGILTQPSMMHESIRSIAEIRNQKIEEVYKEIYRTTCTFYRM